MKRNYQKNLHKNTVEGVLPICSHKTELAGNKTRSQEFHKMLSPLSPSVSKR